DKDGQVRSTGDSDEKTRRGGGECGWVWVGLHWSGMGRVCHEIAKVIARRSGKQVGNDDKEEDVINLTKMDRNSFKIVVALSPKPTVSSDNSKVSSLVNHSITSKVPFPHRFMNSKKEQASRDMLETFPKVQVNILLLDAI
ncbi:unnamed protein product, partial [Prunus brigantina]